MTSFSDLLDVVERTAVERARRDAHKALGRGDVLPGRSPDDLRPIPTSASELAGMVDHCVLAPTATRLHVAEACESARSLGFRALCVNPRWVELAAAELKGTGTAVVCMIAFPQGQSTTLGKVRDAEEAIATGADAVDMVADLSSLRDRDLQHFGHDIAAVVNVAYPHEVIVILETGLLGDVYERALAASVAEIAGASVVKTSSGFAYSADRRDSPRALGAEPKDVATIAAAVSRRVGVKAAGSIRSFEQARRMIAAGATRIGTSNGPLMLQSLPMRHSA